MAKFILAVLAAVFLLIALFRLARKGFKFDGSSRTWLVVALIFGMVSGFLWWMGI